MILLLILLSTIVFGINFFFHGDFFDSSSDVGIYADIARNLVSGNNLTSNTVMATHVYYLPFTQAGNWPPFYPQLYPITIAIGFLLFGVSEISAVAVSGLFFILTLPLVYLLAKKLYNTRVALTASIWYIFSPQLLNYGTQGMSESLFTFLITLAFFLVFVGKTGGFWTGVVIGLSTLTKPQGMLLILPFIAYIFASRSHKKIQLFIFIIGLLLIFILRKILLPPVSSDYTTFSTNQLWSYVASSSISPEDTIFRNLIPINYESIIAHLDLVLKKILINSYYFAQTLYMFAAAPVIALYILSFAKTNENKRVFYFKLFSMCLILLFFFFHAATLLDFRYLHPLLPLVLIVAAGTFVSYIEKWNPKNFVRTATIFTFVFIILSFLTFPGFATSIQRSFAKPRKPTIVQHLGKITREYTASNAIVVSEHFSAIAWYGQRRAILLPLTLAELNTIDKEIISVDTLLLSSHPFKPPLEKEWQDLIDNPRDFGNFRFVKQFDIVPSDNYYRIPAKVVLYQKRK